MAKTTVRRIYQLSLALLFEKENEDPDFLAAYPLLLSKVLMQVLPYENMVRIVDGRPELAPEDVPFIEDVTEDELPFDERFLRTAVPDGIAGLFMADDDFKKAEAVMQYNKFVTQCQEIAPAAFIDLFDSSEEDDGT